MTPEYFSVLATIAVFSVIQSLFGMGVLVFGTPTLLLMGYDFITALSYLLPASFAISLLQVLAAGSNRIPVSRYLYLLCLPGIGVSLWLIEATPLADWTSTLVGVVLLLSALTRLWSPSERLLTALLHRHLPAYHLVMGAVHGLTNLGGALLAILASGTSTGKSAIRYTVAHYYLAFSSVQMVVLATVMGHFDILAAHLSTAVVSSAVYLLIGNRIFVRVSDPIYSRAMTMFMAAYGIVVLLNI